MITKNLKIIGVLLGLVLQQWATAQTISGHLENYANQPVVLNGFYGFNEKQLTTSMTDAKGYFNLNYPDSYVGAAVLRVQGAEPCIVLLDHENIIINRDDSPDSKRLKCSNSVENDALLKGMTLYNTMDEKLEGLYYLLPLYSNNLRLKEVLQNEIKSQEKLWDTFITSLPQHSYAREYLDLRKFIVATTLVAQRQPDQKKQLDTVFASLDFTDDRLWHSGLLATLLSNYYQLQESNSTLEETYARCNAATQVWITSLIHNPERLQEVAQYCIAVLEKRSLLEPASYLARTLLNQNSCQLDDKSIDILEQYRKLAVGNIAPNVVFDHYTIRFKNGVAYPLKTLNTTTTSTLNQLPNAYKLVVFGASWCPHCKPAFSNLVANYASLRQEYDLEIVYISLDTDKKAFESFYQHAPFLTLCDTKGWETPVARDYHVVATPSYFLLDRDLYIKAKVNSPEHLLAWLKNTK